MSATAARGLTLLRPGPWAAGRARAVSAAGALRPTFEADPADRGLPTCGPALTAGEASGPA